MGVKGSGDAGNPGVEVQVMLKSRFCGLGDVKLRLLGAVSG